MGSGWRLPYPVDCWGSENHFKIFYLEKLRKVYKTFRENYFVKNFLSKNENTVGACQKKFKCYDRNYFMLGFEWMYKFTWVEESGLFLMIFSPWGPIFLTQPSTNKIKCILHGKQYLKCSVAEPVLSLIFRGRSRIFGSTPARTLD